MSGRRASSRRQPAPLDVSAFNAALTDRPLWATIRTPPGLWIRWTAAHEEWVESEQPMTYGNRQVGLKVIGRIVRCGRYGEWFVGDWRPKCATCQGTGQVLITAGDEQYRQAYAEAIVSTLDAGLYYMTYASVECPDCLGHPGWVA